jgi:hypothetical protein
VFRSYDSTHDRRARSFVRTLIRLEGDHPILSRRDESSKGRRKGRAYQLGVGHTVQLDLHSRDRPGKLARPTLAHRLPQLPKDDGSLHLAGVGTDAVGERLGGHVRVLETELLEARAGGVGALIGDVVLVGWVDLVDGEVVDCWEVVGDCRERTGCWRAEGAGEGGTHGSRNEKGGGASL